MRTPGSLSLFVLALVLALAGTGPVAAQSPADPPAGEAGEPVAAEAGGSEEETLPPAGDEDEGGPPSDADFVPSERIPADASIAFPVDI